MSTYGDRGNVICLQQRCRWRGISVHLVPLEREASSDRFAEVDIFVGGGAQDRQQEIVMRDLKGAKAELLKQRLSAGIPGVFTCGSPQLLGHYYEPAVGERIEGLGILDLASKHPGKDAKRCIGNLAFELAPPSLVAQVSQFCQGEAPVVVGFENHGGRTYLGEVAPLGRVLSGYGNNGEDGTEGAFYQQAIATYAHGPLLPKNPHLADWLIYAALKHKYARAIALSPLDDSLARAGRAALLQKLNLPTAVGAN